MSPIHTSSWGKPLCGWWGWGTICLGPGEGLVGGEESARANQLPIRPTCLFVTVSKAQRRRMGPAAPDAD